MPLLSLLIDLLILAVALAIVWWIWISIPVPPPFRWVGNVVVGIIALVVLLDLLGGGFGSGLHLLR